MWLGVELLAAIRLVPIMRSNSAWTSLRLLFSVIELGVRGEFIPGDPTDFRLSRLLKNVWRTPSPPGLFFAFSICWPLDITLGSLVRSSLNTTWAPVGVDVSGVRLSAGFWTIGGVLVGYKYSMSIGFGEYNIHCTALAPTGVCWLSWVCILSRKTWSSSAVISASFWRGCSFELQLVLQSMRSIKGLLYCLRDPQSHRYSHRRAKRTEYFRIRSLSFCHYPNRRVYKSESLRVNQQIGS